MLGSLRAARPFGLLALLACALVGTSLRAAPEPSPVPRRWQLDVKEGELRLTTIDLPSTGPRAYFYLTYKVTNNSGSDLLFAPMFEMATDNGKVLRSGRNVPVDVTRAIVDSLENPFMQDQIDVIGTILQGPENAREGVAIWPAETDRMNGLSVYLAGFSGETATVEAPRVGGTGNARYVLRKTLELAYRVPGDLDASDGRPFSKTGKRWIMR